MLISCEKCSTTYVLDDKLIPPQGAPVQCTRCGHVFLAKATPAAAAPPSTSTQMFGAPVGGGGAASPNKTVMFGVPGADGPVPSAAAGAPASRTMMFGQNNEAAQGAPTNRTVMFGAPGNEQPGSGSQGGAPAAANKTVIFGAPGADAPGAGGVNRTMMFGAGGGEAPAGAQPANRTMMFGAPGSEGAPAGPGAANRTMMFGAPGADAPAPSGGTGASSPNKTMMFGADGKEATPPPAQQSTRSTMMFGAVPPNNLGHPTSAPPPRPSNTMMFGTPAAQSGAPQTPPPQQQKTSSTMMFGTPVAAPPPAAAPPAAQKSSSTMIFGAAPVQPAGASKAPKLTESTVRIGPEDLERMMREHEAMGRGAEMTPPEGTPQTAAEARQNKTQMFAMTDQPEGATPPAGNDAVSRQNKTQMFAMSDVEPPKKNRVDPSILDTFPPDGQQNRKKVTPDPEGVHTLMMPGSAGPVPEEEDPRVATTLATLRSEPVPDVAQAAAPPLELPPDPADLMASVNGEGGGSTQPMSPVDADPAAVLRASRARRNFIAGIIIAVIIVGAALALTWKAIGHRLLSKAPPAAAVEGCERALAQLRFDDTKSKAEAVTQLGTLVTQYPDFVEGHAALVTAVSLQLDDVQQRVRRIEQLVERKNSQIARYNREKSPSNWENLASTLTTQVEELIKEHKPLGEEQHNLDTKAREAYKGLESAVNRVGEPSKTAKLAALRAQALFHGVSGTDQALVLTKRYETAAAGANPDGWIELALPEYAANARVSEELMTQAMAKLDELHKRDSTFLRTYVLSARLALIKKDLEGATSDLDQVLSMRKDHDVAIELREWVRKLPKAEEKKEPAP